MTTMTANVERVLTIGLDGATYDLLTPLAQSGWMPNLANLMGESALCTVRSTRPYITPVAWSTFQTGCDPKDHGIWDYRWLDHRRAKVQLNDARRLARPTLFQTLSEVGAEVVSLSLPMTWPVPPGTRGMIVGGLDSPSIETVLAPYPEFAARLRAARVRFDLANVWRRKPETLEELSRGVEQTRAVFQGSVVAARLADEMTDWRMMLVQFQTLDALQHRCWHLLQFNEPSGAPPTWVEKARRAFKALDESLGELLELAARRGASVVVVSDHGFGAFREKITLPELLARRGLLHFPSFSARVGQQAVRLGFKLRKGVWRRLRPGRSTSQLSQPPSALLPADWRKSRALAFHGTLGGLIYFNTPERFRGGPVTTSTQRAQTQAEVQAAFQEAKHPETTEPLFDEVLALDELLGCDPLEHSLPDIVAIPAPGFHTRHKIGPTRRLMRSDPTLTGTHRIEGVLLVRAPGVVLGKTVNADLRDVAPTILQLLGVAIPPSMTGRVLDEILHVAPSSARPETITIPARNLSSAASGQIGEREQAIVESRLRDLGYVD